MDSKYTCVYRHKQAYTLHIPNMYMYVSSLRTQIIPIPSHTKTVRVIAIDNMHWALTRC